MKSKFSRLSFLTKKGKIKKKKMVRMEPRLRISEHERFGAIGNVCPSINLFTGIQVTIYSTIELSDTDIVLGKLLKS